MTWLADLPLDRIWLGVAVHLWQSTLVLIPIVIAVRLSRGAPAAVRNGLWSLGLLKLFLPLSWLGLLAGGLMKRIPGTEGLTVTMPVWVVDASAIIDPALIEAGPTRALSIAFLAVTVLWFVASSVFLVRWFVRVRGIGRVHGIPLPDTAPEIRSAVALALDGTGIPETAVDIVPRDTMPSVKGFLRPRILIPGALVEKLPPPELRCVLLHEDAHRRRRDPLRDILPKAAILFFFYYPLLWPLLKRLRLTREMACDEAALERGTPPSLYKGALVRTLGFGLQTVGLPAIESRGDSTLVRRLRRLDQLGRTRTMSKDRLVLGLCAMLVVAGSFWPLSLMAGSDSESEFEPFATPPKIVHSVAPGYPADGREAGIEGTVRLRIVVGTDGVVKKDIVAQLQIEGAPAFTDSCKAAILQWKFKPALNEEGKPIATQIVVPFEFELDDGGEKSETGEKGKKKEKGE